MKYSCFGVVLSLLVAVLFFASCSGRLETPLPLPTAPPLPSLSPSPLPSQSPSPLPPSPTATPSLTATPTTIPCDASIENCVEAGHFLLERPIAAPGTVTIDPTYPYGSTQQGARQPHHGVEFYNVSGTPVLAAADGIVFVAGNDRQANTFSPWLNFYGNLVVLQHQLPGVNGPVYSLYGHLSKINVSIKQRVHAGEEIGEVGATGAATGSHLHFEVRLGRDDYESNRNPVLWLKPLMNKDGKPFGAIAGRLVDGKGKPLQYTGINIQYFPSPGGAQTAAYQVDTYAPEEHPVRSDDAWLENFTLGDLPAGQYRISIIWSGVLYERWIEVQEGKVTVVAFIIK